MAGNGGSELSGRRGNQRRFQRRGQYVVRRDGRNREEPENSVTTLSQSSTTNVSSLQSPQRPPVTNLSRILVSLTPIVAAKCFSEPEVKARHVCYCLEDLRESFAEWSAYGVEVPLLLKGNYLVKQYYVPLLSGIQLYVDPSYPQLQLRMPGEETDAESSRKARTGGNSDSEVDTQSEASITSFSSAEAVTSFSTAEAESSNSPGKLLFEYLEQKQPHNRRPLADKISVLASRFPELKTLKSCDLLATSWISVAWYPIYRVPVGPTLQDVNASFLTFHRISTLSKCNAQQPFHTTAGQEVLERASLRMSLPIFGFASYKLQGSILPPSGPNDCMQENYLLQAAHEWLQHLHVVLPDYEYFRDHCSRGR